MENNIRIAKYLGFEINPELREFENSDFNYHKSLDALLPVIDKMYNKGNKPNAIITIKPKSVFIDVYDSEGYSHFIKNSCSNMIDGVYYCISEYLNEIEK